MSSKGKHSSIGGMVECSLLKYLRCSCCWLLRLISLVTAQHKSCDSNHHRRHHYYSSWLITALSSNCSSITNFSRLGCQNAYIFLSVRNRGVDLLGFWHGQAQQWAVPQRLALPQNNKQNLNWLLVGVPNAAAARQTKIPTVKLLSHAVYMQLKDQNDHTSYSYLG